MITDWVGTTLSGGRYRITGKLGEGGMGVVYRAWDENVGQDVVVKAPRRAMMDEPGFAARFKDEIRSLIKLSHPHIVKLFDVGEHDGLPFAVMQFLRGGSLEDQATDHVGKPRPLPPSSLKGWLPQVAKALQFMHGQNYVHRDVKPANILFDDQGNAYLSDFGVNKALDRGDAAVRAHTGTGMVLGTPHYMAPELAQGADVDGRIDQYALAVTVHEVLGGQKPFDGPTGLAIMFQHVNQPPPCLDALVPGIPRALAEAVIRALDKNPENRFKTCAAFAASVLTAVSGGTQAAVASGTTASASFPTSATYSLARDPTALQGGRPSPRVKAATADAVVAASARIRSAVAGSSASTPVKEPNRVLLSWLKSPPGVIAALASGVVAIGLLVIAAFSSRPNSPPLPNVSAPPTNQTAPNTIVNAVVQSSDDGSVAVNQPINEEPTPTFMFDSPVPLTADGAAIDLRSTAAPRFVDWNGDGALDLLVADGDGHLWLFRGKPKNGPDFLTGERLKAAGREITLGKGGTGACFADMDGDDKPDIIASGNDRRVRYYPNTGGRWTPIFKDFVIVPSNQGEFVLPESVSGRIEIADWDLDDLPDLLAGGYEGNITFYRNTGTAGSPEFGASGVRLLVGGSVLQESYNVHPRVLDINRDGNPDLAFGVNWGYVKVLINTEGPGATSFATARALQNRAGSQLNIRLLIQDDTIPDFADLTGDGVLDLISGGLNGRLFLLPGVLAAR